MNKTLFAFFGTKERLKASTEKEKKGYKDHREATKKSFNKTDIDGVPHEWCMCQLIPPFCTTNHA